MTDNNHPITPPPELVALLRSEAPQGIRDAGVTRELHLITAAYRAGADQELEACVELLTCRYGEDSSVMSLLRAARRSKPPSLKEQSIALIDKIQGNKEMWQTDDLDVVRRALESLPD